MATRRKSSGSSGRRSRSTGKRNGGDRGDAITLLKADHRQVEGWFEQFRKSRLQSKKAELAGSICYALRMHTQIEEEIFYPAFLAAAGDEHIHHEAEIEHEGAKRLIAEIEQTGPADEYFEARLNVLAEMIRHHVKEEEKRDGMFARARQTDMSLDELGERLRERKAELQGTLGGSLFEQAARDARQTGLR